LLIMESIALAARVLLALVFVTAAAGKFADQPGTRQALADFGMPTRSLRSLGFLLPLAELAIAVALLVQPTARWGALGAVVLLLSFVAAIARAMARGEAPDCHCFGQISSSPAGPTTLVRNAILAAPALLVVAYGPGESISAWISARSGAELVAVATGVAAIALGAICVRMWLTNKQLRADLARAEASAAAFPPGLPIGAPAPGFELPAVDGGTTTLEALLARGAPVALVFVSPSCSACVAMFDDFARWQTILPDRVTIALVAAGKQQEVRRLAEEYGLRNVLMQSGDAEVFHAYRASATPSVVIVGPDGLIASPTRATHALVEALVRRAVHSDARPAGAPSTAANGGRAEVLQWPNASDAGG
jgi:uncharacterized membrane protein YphA (DoxX/SURF4 family)/peroxiredoxin